MNKATIPKAVQEAKYAVRGAVQVRAAAIKKEMAAGKKFKFNRLVALNSGNAMAFGQPPITFGREVLSIVLHEQSGIKADFSRYSKDSIDRAKRYLDSIEARAIGAYAAHASGYDPIKQDIADFIKRRDGHDIDLNNVYLSTGASECIELFIRLAIGSPDDGIMVPFPNYPLYSAWIHLNGGHQVPYLLDESQNWSLNIEGLEKSYNEHRDKGINVKAIAVLNPGNPTGHVLTKENIKQILEFAYDKKMLVIADEVYQENICTDKKFYSMRSVMHELGDPIKSNLEIVSMHSASKGFTSECGLRGGYFEFENLDPFAMEMVYKLKSMRFCAPTPGMIAVGTMVNPPREGVNSPEVVDLYNKEKDSILKGMRTRSHTLYQLLNKIPGVVTNPTEGAPHLFPKIDLPEKFKKEAESLGLEPDMHFCLHLLEETGMITVPGSGFGQDEGTSHFRMTTLICDDAVMKESMERMHDCIQNLLKNYK